MNRHSFNCAKHGPYQSASMNGTCPHCAEDEKVLEERIEDVVAASRLAVIAQTDRFWTDKVQEARWDALRDALRSLVREVRRG